MFISIHGGPRVMDGRLTEEQIAEIRVRVEKATPGPWNIRPAKHYAVKENEFMDVDTGRHGPWDEWFTLRNDDALFVFHSRTDIPALLFDLETLRARRPRIVQMIFNAFAVLIVMVLILAGVRTELTPDKSFLIKVGVGFVSIVTLWLNAFAAVNPRFLAYGPREYLRESELTHEREMARIARGSTDAL